MSFFAHYFVMPIWIRLFSGSTICGAYQHSYGARTADNESIGNSMKIHLVVGSGGLPAYYELSCGNTHDIILSESLVTNCLVKAGKFRLR